MGRLGAPVGFSRPARLARLTQRSGRATLGRLPLTADVIAGVSVALILVPQSLAYAQVAGMPPIRGLYAAALPPIAAAIFASSPYLQTGPVAMTALLAFGVLSAQATPGSDEYIQLGILLALVVGIARFALGLLRGGVVAYLMSQPLLMGFVPAAAILIIATQLPTALGVSPPGGGVFEEAARSLAHPGDWEITSLVLALLVVPLILLGPRLYRLFPGVLVAVAAAIAFSLASGYRGPTVGEIPAGLPPFGLDVSWGALPALLVGGAVIALVGFAEPSSIARTFATADRQRWNADRELVSQGSANIVAAVSGGFPVGGSFSRSALNRQAGARTRWSGAITGAVVLAFLPFAGSLESLPRAVLGAIVIGAVLPLVRLPPLLRLWRHSKPQFAVAWATFGLTLGLAPDIQWAVVAGIGLAIAVHLARELSLDIEVEDVAGTLHLRPIGVLWFGSANVLENAFVDILAKHRDAERLLIHLGGVGRVDLSGALVLRRLVQQARSSGLEVELANVPPRARRWVASLIEPAIDPFDSPRG
ncbi:MAG: SulP family inorganic anion transporter [Actinomycetia bacterium]|nr:SulP family inorganic anion transporter [Actinomycetes bacterium]